MPPRKSGIGPRRKGHTKDNKRALLPTICPTCMHKTLPPPPPIRVPPARAASPRKRPHAESTSFDSDSSEPEESQPMSGAESSEEEEDIGAAASSTSTPAVPTAILHGRRDAAHQALFLRNPNGRSRGWRENELLLCALNSALADPSLVGLNPTGPWLLRDPLPKTVAAVSTLFGLEDRGKYLRALHAEHRASAAGPSERVVPTARKENDGRVSKIANAINMTESMISKLDQLCVQAHSEGRTVVVGALRKKMQAVHPGHTFTHGSIKYALKHYLDRAYGKVQRRKIKSDAGRDDQARAFLVEYSQRLKWEAEGSVINCYTDETYSHPNDGKACSWIKQGERLNKAAGKGTRLIVVS